MANAGRITSRTLYVLTDITSKEATLLFEVL
jgi:hypothetical protein